MPIIHDDRNITIDFEYGPEAGKEKEQFRIKYHYTDELGPTISFAPCHNLGLARFEDEGFSYVSFPVEMVGEAIDFLIKRRLYKSDREPDRAPPQSSQPFQSPNESQATFVKGKTESKLSVPSVTKKAEVATPQVGPQEESQEMLNETVVNEDIPAASPFHSFAESDNLGDEEDEEVVDKNIPEVAKKKEKKAKKADAEGLKKQREEAIRKAEASDKKIKKRE
jgi:hypothetical protein